LESNWVYNMKKRWICLIVFGFTLNSYACTGMRLTAKDGTSVHGRTLEFATKVDLTLAVIPRHYRFVGTTAEGKGITYVSKYAAVGAMAFDIPALMDGLNEKGLAVGTFYFPTFAGYSNLTKDNQNRALSPIEFPNWILSQFETVEEVKKALSQIVIVPIVSTKWGNTSPPFHYIVYDKKGGCLVIEPLDGKLVATDNPLGVFTNSPSFGWHMINLRNYIHLDPFNAPSAKILDVTLPPLGSGSGLLGLPGDFTPPSRFVRAAFFSSMADNPPNAEEAVFELFHLLNPFDIPLGSVRDQKDNHTYNDQTQVTTVRDPEALNYYFKTYEDQTIKKVNLKKFDFNAKTIKKWKATGKGAAEDISAQLKESS
jgi:choloylglycine hydrolase